MSNQRQRALNIVQQRTTDRVFAPADKISDFYAEHVFNMDKMRATLAPETFKKVESAIKKGKKIDLEAASEVASAVKTWALSKGTTHYTHWFQPLTGATAEKHDSFFDAHKGIEVFKASALIQQEPDASSFPNGGIRSTFEARGYTAWDPSSPIFIWGRTLCIPTVFVSYTGEALDYKAPLLKAVEAVDKAATKVCQLFDRNVNRVSASLGCEQEYFVVDRALYNARPDLVMAGRTVFGHHPARGQQLDDHYFGAIPSRVYNYMKDFEIECLKLGIPVSTRHNEVAPSQFEVAPIFEDINVATDHNSLMMDVMARVAERHDLAVLFHEKPFAGLNGSGKHNNWSLITSTGVNVFQPSTSARENLQFLTFLVNTIKAIHSNAGLLRASIASAGNDHRLGANEAPPAIMSVFLGSDLTAVLDELENNGNIKVDKGDNMYMKLGIDKIPHIILDNTDRNRTSPFAFTGNKFEFRAVGSDQNVAEPMTVLNLIMAKQLKEFYGVVNERIDKGEDKKIAIVNVLREYIKESKAVRFEGDGYSSDWAKEAEKRGLPNVKDTARALDAYVSDQSKAIFEEFGVMSAIELEARNEIQHENYIMKLQIEARLISEIARTQVIPAALKYQNKLITNAKGLKEFGLDTSHVTAILERVNGLINTIQTKVQDMNDERGKVNDIEGTRERAIAYCDNLKAAYFDDIRAAVDKLEVIIDDEDWPLLKYREMLFLR
ncbi:glutamine synthetase [Roseivirga pacifica]|uniref:Glutamine synthetase n=1 Tax=Roseivirga pacifica TaxID=1267423 RepID=A0A1I0QUX0_9BACT|nr:glutamine synthetase III [Roseivirga pacifica]MCO6357223.1 glutamine synthetase type III [Roseivirga pacifica]MCO6368063.1 glutamine synthetase type III [Roseivirga pacifica]MCO6369455.1 glutamine synthetase type III [Roseivirga pacifica]MCO6373309.1 glutamine synthetase type III [Roseivirga pacifica]MCO6377434.1 glutamine synthetase type III [Roseivirga pacifica]